MFSAIGLSEYQISDLRIWEILDYRIKASFGRIFRISDSQKAIDYPGLKTTFILYIYTFLNLKQMQMFLSRMPVFLSLKPTPLRMTLERKMPN